MVNQHHQRKHQCNHQERRYQRYHLSGSGTDVDGIGDKGNGGILLCQTAGDVRRQVLEQIAHADGGNHNGHTGRRTQGLICRTFNGKADNHRQNQHQRHGDVQRQRRGQVNHHNTSHHKHIAVCKVNQPQDTVNHGITNGNQRILTTDGNA